MKIMEVTAPTLSPLGLGGVRCLHFVPLVHPTLTGKVPFSLENLRDSTV